MPSGSTHEALLHLRRYKVFCRSEAGVCTRQNSPGSFYSSWKRLATLPQIDGLVCLTHTKNTKFPLSGRQKEDVHMHFIWQGFWRPEIPHQQCWQVINPIQVLVSRPDDAGSRSWCLDLSLQQGTSGFAQRGSKHPHLHGLEAVDCFTCMCGPKTRCRICFNTISSRFKSAYFLTLKQMPPLYQEQEG